MKFKWPWVSRKMMDAELASQSRHIRNYERAERERLEADWEKQWQPLLKKAIALSASQNPARGDFAVHVGLDRGMMEMAASHNDPKVWEYISEQLSYEFRRQIATLNFAGLHRLARETEYGRAATFSRPISNAYR
jgi:hypothetical protein